MEEERSVSPEKNERDQSYGMRRREIRATRGGEISEKTRRISATN